MDGELLVQSGVYGDAVLHHEPPADDGVPRRDRSAAQPRLDRVRQRTSESHAGQRPHHEVPARPHRQLADLPGAPLVTAGATLAAGAGGGLYWTVPALVAGFVGAVFNAWVLLVEILR